MKFGEPQYLYLLLALIPLVPFLVWAGRKRRALLETFLDSGMASRLLGNRIYEQRQNKIILWLTAIGFIIFALSQPRLGFEWEDLTQEGVDVMVAIDLSTSMRAQDIKPSRLERAKYKVADLLNMLDGDRIGLVAFAGTSFLQCPLTLDYKAAEIFLNSLDTDLIPVQGTAIGHAIRTATWGFSEIEKKSKVIILITDGEDHEGDALKAAELAQKEGVRIFVIGMGLDSGAPIPSPHPGGGFKKDARGDVVLSHMNEDFLQEIAAITGGSYVRSVMGDSDLEQIYLKEIKQTIEKKKLRTTRRKIWQERFQWFLGLALLLLVLESGLSEKEPRRQF